MRQLARVISVADPVRKHRPQGGGMPKVGDVVELWRWYEQDGDWWAVAVERRPSGDRLYGANFLPSQLEILGQEKE